MPDISQNIDSILAFYRRKEKKNSDSQRLLESVGGFMSRLSRLHSVLHCILGGGQWIGRRAGIHSARPITVFAGGLAANRRMHAAMIIEAFDPVNDVKVA